LPLQDIENIMKQAAEDSSGGNFTIKEKADNIASLFQKIADKRGLVHKLNKKPANKKTE
jgi:hypothetical protein